MRILDAYILARTKRGTRRIRTALVVIVSSLLFAVLFGAAFITAGLVKTADQVKDVGFNGHYMTWVNDANSLGDIYGSVYGDVKKQVEDELRARKVKVDDKLIQDMSYNMEIGRRMAALVNIKAAEHTDNTEAWIKQHGKPKAMYRMGGISSLLQGIYPQTDLSKDPQADEMVEQAEKGQAAGGKFMQQDNNLSFYSVDKGFLFSQIRPGQNLSWQAGEAYPMVVPYSYLEKLSGTSFAKVDAAAKNAGYKKLIKEYTGKELTYCYRNASASSLLSSVVEYNKAARTDTDKATNPVDVPVCGAFDPTVLKKIKVSLVPEADPNAVKPLFATPKPVEPITRELKFKLVGFVPAQVQFGASDIVGQIISGITTWPAAMPGLIPSDIVAADPLLASKDDDSGFGFNLVTQFVDFNTRADQKQFVDAGCAGNACNNRKVPQVTSFGNVGVALEDVFKAVFKFFVWAAIGVTVIAAAMIMFTISKVIADSSKEIAVFRSLGARRRDIAQIYTTYGLMLAGSSLVVACALAVIGAMVAGRMFTDRLVELLVQNTGAYTTVVHGSLLGFRPVWLLAVTGVLLVAASIGIAVPVLLSARRKLITILREE